MPIDRVGKSELPASGRLRQFARRVQSTAETTLVKYHNTIETIQPGKRPGLDSLDIQQFIELQVQFFQTFQTEKGVGLKGGKIVRM